MGARATHHRRRRDASGHVDPFAQRRKRFAEALELVDGGEAAWSFARMPRFVQEQFWREKLPDPVVVYGAGFPADRALRDALELAVREAMLETDDTAIAVRDVYGVIVPCARLVASMPAAELAGAPAEVRAFFEEAGPPIIAWIEAHERAAGDALWAAVTAVAQAASRIDGRVLSVWIDCVANERGKAAVRVLVDGVEPQARQVTLDGSSRPAYRAARGMGKDAERWLSWSAEQVGRPDLGDGAADGAVPVYVQSHALHQLADRVNLPAAGPFLQAWMAKSLEEPKIVERQRGGDLLVEFRVFDYRLGYFVATRVAEGGGMIVIRTFLFLTMDPTPESRKLATQLRLSRREKDWLGLTDLAAFTQTDLRNDPVLRPLLAECGCGHLFDLATDRTVSFAPQAKPLAMEMKKFLRMAA